MSRTHVVQEMVRELEARIASTRHEISQLANAEHRRKHLEGLLPEFEAEKARYDAELAGAASPQPSPQAIQAPGATDPAPPVPVTPGNDDTTGEGDRKGEPAPAQPEDGSVHTGSTSH